MSAAEGPSAAADTSGERAQWNARLAGLTADARVAAWCAQQREPAPPARSELPALARGALTLAILCSFFACLYAPLAPVLLPALALLALVALVVAARARHRSRAPASAGCERELGVLLERSARFEPDRGHGPGRVSHRGLWLTADGRARECTLDEQLATDAPLRTPGLAFRRAAHLVAWRALPPETS